VITLQGSFLYQGEIAVSPFPTITLAALFPIFEYAEAGTGTGKLTRRVATVERREAVQALASDSYRILVPVSDLGRTHEAITDFLRFTTDAIGAGSIGQLSFSIPVEFDAASAFIGTTTLQAICLVRNLSKFYNPAGGAPLDIPAFLEENVWLINGKQYYAMLPEFETLTALHDHWLLLSIIQRLVEEADIDPALPVELDGAITAVLVRILHEANIEPREEVLHFVGKALTQLVDFPILVPAIEPLVVEGIFEVKMADDAVLAREDLLFYDMSLEYIKREPDSGTTTIVHYDWKTNDLPISGNSIRFSFSDMPPVMLSNLDGPITLSVRAFDGALLWGKDYEPAAPELREVRIVVVHLRPVTIGIAPDSPAETGKKLRGRVLELTKRCPLKDLTIVVQARKEGDALWRVVAAASTDASGNFSMPYPYGVFTKAQAIVSLTPDSPADIPIKAADKPNETIADDFLYLLISNPECPDLPKPEDCDCDAPKKAGRLPDQADLISSDEYTQDIGGSCVNLSTPHRTLNEYRYTAIVRTSDPDVANYTLVKNSDGSFALTGGHKRIKRAPVDIDNPIRWQDAPDANANLSLYQSLTVATGHVLHYKAEFKADGYSLGNLLYSLGLAPGQKKQIVVIDSAHTLEAAESQTITQGESLAANLLNERSVTDQLAGRIDEALRGSSSASTGGVSAGLGVAGSMGVVSGALGVVGGYSSSSASASQNGSRDTSMFFGEKLRQLIMQNAESYRQLNASVVTSVKEGQQYSVTTEVVANHNHCHALTMMYFEVLRHYAIFQELVNVEECVFVPLLLTNFSRENIYKWSDVLARNLLPIPSNTYLQPYSFLRYLVRHPLIPAFDANERQKTSYANVDFPEGAYSDEPITSLSGYITIRVNIPRPKSKYDRIKSFPVVKKETVTNRTGGGMFGAIVSLVVGDRLDITKWEEKVKFTDEHIVIYDNFQEARPADVIEVVNFKDFFASSKDNLLWEAVAGLCGYSDVELFLANYFSHKTISQWDTTFQDEIAPVLFESLVEKTISIRPLPAVDFTTVDKYKGGERLMRLNLGSNTSLSRKDIKSLYVAYAKTVVNSATFWPFVTFVLENVNLNYTTKHYQGYIVNKYVGDDLADDTWLSPYEIAVPMNSSEQRNPKKEDEYLVRKLIEHLNSNLEYYNKTLWYHLDPDRRYMLLDGFSLQLYNDFGVPVGTRSLASVVKNELLSIAGNSLVLPVAAGYRVNRSYIAEKNAHGEPEQISLFDHYKPLTPVPPYRISVPSRGIFLEAIQGACDACEKIKENSSQDWTKFPTDEPTPVMPVTPPVPTITDWKAAFKDFAPPLINIQNAPAMPAPGAGLAGLSELLGKAGIFKDVTGLDATQQNVMRTYLSNQENARAFAEMAKSMAMQEHNTAHSDKIMDSLKTANDSGAINQEEYGALVKGHLQQQIDGGEAANREKAEENKKLETSPIKAAVDLAQMGTEVSATESDAEGNTKTLGTAGNPELRQSFWGLPVPQWPSPFAAIPLDLDEVGLVRDDALSKKLSTIAAATPDAGLAAIDLSTKKFGSVQGGTMKSLLSAGKLGVAVAAYRLREAAREFAKKSAVTTKAALIEQMEGIWTPSIKAIESNSTRPVMPALDKILYFNPPGKPGGDWDIDFATTPSLAYLPAETAGGGVICRPELGFKERMFLMIRCSNNAAASLCIDDLGYRYIRGALRAEGFDIKRGLGFWIGGNYPPRNEQEKFPPVEGSPISATPDALVMLIGALESDLLVSPDASHDIINMMTGGGSFIARAFSGASINTKIEYVKDGANDVGVMTEVAVCRKPVSDHRFAIIIMQIPHTHFGKAAIAIDGIF
jgi:hypothetical protein